MKETIAPPVFSKMAGPGVSLIFGFILGLLCMKLSHPKVSESLNREC